MSRTPRDYDLYPVRRHNLLRPRRIRPGTIIVHWAFGRGVVIAPIAHHASSSPTPVDYERVRFDDGQMRIVYRGNCKPVESADG